MARAGFWSVPVAAASLLGLAGLTLAFLSGPAGAATVGSVSVEDGSALAYVNDTLTIDASLGGPHAGMIVITNNSLLTLTNVTVVFANASAGGGIFLDSGGRLEANRSTLTADPAAEFAIRAASASSLHLNRTTVSGLQVMDDLGAPGITLAAGASLRAESSVLRVRPDLRPLLAATQSDVTLIDCNVTGAIWLTASTATLTLLQQRVIGETKALDLAGAAVTLTNSTVVATGGASALSARAGSSLTVRSTNVSADDIGVAAVDASTVVLEGVVIQAGTDLGQSIGAFGVAADGSTVTARNVAFLGFATSLWLKNSAATFNATQLGAGLIRLNASTASMEGVPSLQGLAIIERASTLTLTDVSLDWSRIDIVPGSVVIPRYRPTFQFFDDASLAAVGAAWSVFPTAGLAVGSGTSDAAGGNVGPPLEGPRFTSDGFQAPATYRIQILFNNASFNESITAWGPGLLFSFYLDTTLSDFGFSTPLVFSDAHPPVGSGFTVASNLLLTGPGGLTVYVRVLVDGAEGAVQPFTLATGATTSVQFTLNATAGLHLVTLRADGEGGARGSINERNEVANNFVAMWYNASANVTTTVKPDLVVSPGGFRFVYVNASAPDPVTGGPRDARELVVLLNITNTGLTDTGPFDVVIAAGEDSRRKTIPGIPAGGSANFTATFGPFLESRNIEVIARLDVTGAVDEGSESNNGANATASVYVPPYTAPPRPLWVVLLVVITAVALLALSAWGLVLIFRSENDEGLVPEDKKVEAAANKPATVASPGSAAPTSTQGAPAAGPVKPAAGAPAAEPPPPPSQPAPARPTAAAGPPPRPPPMPPQYPAAPPPPGYPAPQAPYGYPYGGYYPQPVAYPQYPPQPYAAPAGPPARCPRCGSTQLSYMLQPTRAAICSTCQLRTPF